MVSDPVRRAAPRARRGTSTTGCLVSLALLAVGVYYGVNIGRVYFRYYRLLDEMETQAQLAAALDDGTIRRRVQTVAQELGLPSEAQNVRVLRRASPRGIVIECAYRETVQLPLFNHTFIFHPKVTQPL
jgi:hypothetical protein